MVKSNLEELLKKVLLRQAEAEDLLNRAMKLVKQFVSEPRAVQTPKSRRRLDEVVHRRGSYGWDSIGENRKIPKLSDAEYDERRAEFRKALYEYLDNHAGTGVYFFHEIFSVRGVRKASRYGRNRENSARIAAVQFLRKLEAELSTGVKAPVA